MSKLKILIILSMITITLFFNCSNPDILRGPVPVEKEYIEGTMIRLSLRENDVANRTVVPDISMDIVNYDIRGFGPSGATFEELNWPIGSLFEKA